MALAKLLRASARPSPHVQFGGARSEPGAPGRRVQVASAALDNTSSTSSNGHEPSTSARASHPGASQRAPAPALPLWAQVKPADSLESPFRELELTELWDGTGKTRVRQHVNPLRREFQVPVAAPDWAAVFADPTLPLAVDIGSGYGRFLLLLQRNNPNRRVNYLGVEIRRTLVERSNEWVARLGLGGAVHYVFANATVSLEALLGSYPGPVTDAFVQFPDPHFKRRHRKRRVVQRPLVNALAAAMPPGGRVLLQSDVEAAAVAMRNAFEAWGPEAFTLAPEHSAPEAVFFGSSSSSSGGSSSPAPPPQQTHASASSSQPAAPAAAAQLATAISPSHATPPSPALQPTASAPAPAPASTSAPPAGGAAGAKPDYAAAAAAAARHAMASAVAASAAVRQVEQQAAGAAAAGTSCESEGDTTDADAGEGGQGGREGEQEGEEGEAEEEGAGAIDIDALESLWAAGGWLRENPVGTPTEREHYVLQQGLPVYRVLLVRK
ncbi:hypothetical protein HXX76_012962 [Chlamydomonas incerta]|uniref:tRNA (guanine(46)-N(7))-methyltransferase n=1 Tax=Chlamydomonas incerta TaxID=51695 RepID=A0A835SQY8_CHLIN|nr:hypothetical protein HXX76_012962 [Chlamydomonas incerta]|eukprot:KAG2426649.1 hypothetical protein HXX76_012962 [Chlamydomonas incerta]